MISDEAVIAAAKAIEDALRADQGVRSIARDALAAAAPHMQRAVLLGAADALENQPPRLKYQTVATLRLYAAEPWRINNAGTCPSECAASHPGSEHPNPYRSQS